jgi:hypothetical protein
MIDHGDESTAKHRLKPRDRSGLKRLIVAGAALLLSSCAAPYMTAQDCADFCHAEGKKVEAYSTGVQIPILHPRPNARCTCEDSPRQ